MIAVGILVLFFGYTVFFFGLSLIQGKSVKFTSLLWPQTKKAA